MADDKEPKMDKSVVTPADGREMHPSLKKAREQQDAGPSYPKTPLCEIQR